ncbi:phosphate-starvation-inducible protein PsiE [Thiobacter aerophilum]|uniref:Protein PsiE n=1 Tax=Thiobacter aerophilum TaxID=3121275 RepID=A0ABV0EE66_9BURK
MSGFFFDWNKRVLAFTERVGLFIIAVATVIATAQEVGTMIEARHVRLADLLLLFIYLEVLTMVGLYYGSGKLPVRFPLYIAMVALARYLILDMKEMDVWRMLAVTSAILLLALAVLAIRYGHTRYPYPQDDAHAELRPPHRREG